MLQNADVLTPYLKESGFGDIESISIEEFAKIYPSYHKFVKEMNRLQNMDMIEGTISLNNFSRKMIELFESVETINEKLFFFESLTVWAQDAYLSACKQAFNLDEKKVERLEIYNKESLASLVRVAEQALINIMSRNRYVN